MQTGFLLERSSTLVSAELKHNYKNRIEVIFLREQSSNGSPLMSGLGFKETVAQQAATCRTSSAIVDRGGVLHLTIIVGWGRFCLFSFKLMLVSSGLWSSEGSDW